MNKYKKYLLNEFTILALIILIPAGGYGLKRLIDFHGQWRSRISQTIPADINGDGKPELILIYAAHPYWNRSLVEALELPGRKRLWTREVLPQNASRLSGGPPYFHIVDNRLFLMNEYRENEKDIVHVTALDMSEGKKLWEQRLPSKHYLHHLAGMTTWKDRLIVFSRESKGEIFLTQFHKETGKKIRQDKWPPNQWGLPGPPQIIGNHLLISTFQKTYILRIETGKWKSFSSHSPGFSLSGRHLYFANQGNTHQLREIIFPELKNRTLISGLKELDFNPRMLSPTELLYVSHLPKKNRRQKLYAHALSGKGPVKSIALPQGWAFAATAYDWKYYVPRFSAFHRIQSRYQPLILRHSKSGNRRLVIFDRKKFKFVWRSQVLEHSSHFYPRNIFKVGNRYFIHVERSDVKSEDPDDAFLLILNGESGKFESIYTIQLKGRKGFYSHHYYYGHKPWNVHGDLLFGSDDDQFWAIDLKAKRLRFHDPERARLIVNPPGAEKYFGRLPLQD